MLAELKKLWTELGEEIKLIEAKLGIEATALEADAKRDALKDLTPTASTVAAPVVAPPNAVQTAGTSA